MALSGTLGDFSLTDILQLIGLQRKTGVLVLRRGEQEVSIGFDAGRVVSAESSRVPTDVKMGQLLVRTGKLSEERLGEALRRQKVTLQRLGHVLTEQNWVDRETVRRQLLLQVTETIYELFRWRDGEYDFRPDARVEWDRGFLEPIPTENLLMEGARMVDEWPLLERVIPSRGLVLRTTPRAGHLLALADSREARGSVYEHDIDFDLLPNDDDTGRAHRKLSDRELAVLRWVDGCRTAGEVAELTGFGEFEAFRLLAQLVQAELLEPAQAPVRERARGLSALLLTAAPARALSAAVVVLAILGGAAALQEAIRAVLPGPSILPAATPIASSDALAAAADLDALRRVATEATLDRIQAALAAHYLDQGTWARTLGELVARGLIPDRLTRDAWGDPVVYTFHAWGYRLAAGRTSGTAVRFREYRFSPAERPSGSAEIASLP